ncbi:MAG TPA: biotin/lipoyl-containing protein [Chloroflexota bacterium]|nr:biotin/lipoyl-containing protein [Chloroflexota bacterium]
MEAGLEARAPVKYYVTIEDRVVEVEVTDTPAGTTATIEGRTFDVDLLPVSAEELFSLVVDSQSHEVLVEDVEGGIEVIVGGELFRIVVQDEWERRLANIQRKSTAVTGETVVKAPMPGQVVGVPVQPGDAIKTGQGLVILSAMKMENEIRSPRDGAVVAVHIGEGDKVEQGAPLVTIGPGT